MTEEETILYERVKRRIENFSDSLYFRIGRRIEKSTFLSIKTLSVLAVTLVTIFFISGGIVALDNPYAGFFSRTTASQSPGETTLYFLLNGMTFLGVFLMGRSVTKKSLDKILFGAGLVLFLLSLISITSLMCTVKIACY